MKTFTYPVILILLTGAAIAGYNPKVISVKPSRPYVEKGSGQAVTLTATFTSGGGAHTHVDFELAGNTAQVPANPSGTISPAWDITGKSFGVHKGYAKLGEASASSGKLTIWVHCNTFTVAVWSLTRV